MSSLFFKILTAWVVLLYILPFEYSATLDLPNHLARAKILLTCFSQPEMPVCAHYVVKFIPVPYILADSILLLLEAVLPASYVERAAIALLMLGYLFSWTKLFLAVHPQKNIAYYAGLLFTFNCFLAKGFFAYLLSINLCLLILAWWWPKKDHKSLFNQLVLAGGLCLLFLVHLAGFVICAIAIFTYDLHHIIKLHWRQSLPFILKSWPVVIVTSCLYLFQQLQTRWSIAIPSSFQDGVTPFSLEWLTSKLLRSLYIFVNYDKYSEVLLAMVVLIAVLSSIPFRKIRALVGSYWTLLSIVLAWFYIITPDVTHGVVDVDLRFVIPIFLSLFLASASLVKLYSILSLALLPSLLIYSSIQIYYKTAAQTEVTEIMQVIKHIPAGSSLTLLSSKTVFPNTKNSRANPYAHLAANYILSGGQLVDGLFECSMNVNTPYFCQADQQLWHSSFRRQFGGLNASQPSEIELVKRKFDYFLILGAEQQLVDLTFPLVDFDRFYQRNKLVGLIKRATIDSIPEK